MTARGFQVALFALVLVVTTVLSLAMPSLTRSGILFGVTVPAGARAMPPVRAIIRRFRAQVAILALAAAAALLPASLALSGVLLVGALILALVTGQGGSRLPSSSPTDRMDDRNWKLGAFYVNRDDPALFVERRVGFGWTLNFGNPWAILATLGLIAIIVLSSVLPAMLSR